MVAQTTLNKYGTELLNLYVLRYTERYGKAPLMNRHKNKWGFIDMATDLGLAGGKDVIEYYFTTSRFNHPLEYLLYNYEKLYNIKKEIDEDAVRNEELRALTKAEVEKRFGNG